MENENKNLGEAGKGHGASPSVETKPTPELSAAQKLARDAFRNSVGFQINFVLYSGLEIQKAIDHVCSAADRLLATAFDGKDCQYVKRLENAFLMVYDLAGMDTHPLPEALPESAYVPGYMDKVRELREVFALVSKPDSNTAKREQSSPSR